MLETHTHWDVLVLCVTRALPSALSDFVSVVRWLTGHRQTSRAVFYQQIHFKEPLNWSGCKLHRWVMLQWLLCSCKGWWNCWWLCFHCLFLLLWHKARRRKREHFRAEQEEWQAVWKPGSVYYLFTCHRCSLPLLFSSIFPLLSYIGDVCFSPLLICPHAPVG